MMKVIRTKPSGIVFRSGMRRCFSYGNEKFSQNQQKALEKLLRNNQLAKYALVQFLDSQKALSTVERDRKYAVSQNQY